MKKLLLSAACVAAVMCSCTSEEENVTAVASGDKLSFSTYVDMNSRALDKSSFAVNDVLCINAFQYSGSLSDSSSRTTSCRTRLLPRQAQGGHTSTQSSGL